MSHGIVYTESLLDCLEGEREQLRQAHLHLAGRMPVRSPRFAPRRDGVELAVLQASGALDGLLADDLGEVTPDRCTECARFVVGLRALRGRRQCSAVCARIAREGVAWSG